eukprot:GHVN01077617.1.p1 GENE.GHVN01077617.1~~GHVN01077617.1.p1  ORF type:complete len:159 (-),score=10.68 GHVN01077617.1:1273-1749(-)
MMLYIAYIFAVFALPAAMGASPWMPLDLMESMDELESLTPPLFGALGFGALDPFEGLASMLGILDQAGTGPAVNMDYSGADCLVTVSGLEGFDPKTDSLSIRVRPSSGELSGIVTIVYKTHSDGSDDALPSGSQRAAGRLRGKVSFSSEMSHIVNVGH